MVLNAILKIIRIVDNVSSIAYGRLLGLLTAMLLIICLVYMLSFILNPLRITCLLPIAFLPPFFLSLVRVML